MSDDARLPREVLRAQESPLSDDPQFSLVFANSPWKDGDRLSHTRVRYRDDDGNVTRVVASWAPSALVETGVLAECDDERVLWWLVQRHGRRAAAAFSDETVTVWRATDEDVEVLQLTGGDDFVIHACHVYYNALEEPLLCQCTLMTSNHRLFLRRPVDPYAYADPGPPDQSPGGPS